MSGSARNHMFFAIAAGAALLSTAGTPLAYGQTAAQSSADAAKDEEIIVTATRREARLQDVPISVTPITSALIERSGVRDLQDLQGLAPSLQFNVAENEGSATARLRGIGTQGTNPGLESSVGIFIDGVYRARNGVALGELGEVSQIEVLRGPQGTLFGRNTSAGLITVATKEPDLSNYGGEVEATYGNYNETRISGSVTGPILAETLGFRLFASKSTRDGFFDVVDEAGRKTDANNRDVWSLRGQLLWAPSDDLRARLIVDYSERDELCCGAAIYNPTLLNGTSPATAGFPAPSAQVIAGLGGYGPGGLAALGNGDIERRQGFGDRLYDQDVKDSGVSLEVNYDFGGPVLTSISAVRSWDLDQGQDLDYSAADIFYRPADHAALPNGYGFEVITQELRLAGQNGPLDWLVGGYYSNEILKGDVNTVAGSEYQDYFRAQIVAQLTAAPLNVPLLTAQTQANTLLGPLAAAEGVAGGRDRHRQSSESIALFTHNIISLGERTDLTLGARYTQDEKSLKSSFRTPFNGAAAFAPVSTSMGFLGLPTALQTRIGAIYTGFPYLRNDLDAAGYNLSWSTDEWSGVVSLRQELNDAISGYVSYSRGYKSGGYNLDRDFDRDPSFGSETVDAYEVGVKSAWMDGALLLNSAIYYNTYENFQLNSFNGQSFVVQALPEVVAQGVELDLIWTTPIDGLSLQGGVAYSEAEYGDFTVPAASPNLSRLPESRLTNAPLWTATNAVTYETPLFDGAVIALAYVDARYVSSQNTGSDLDPRKVQPEYTLVNARLGLSTGDRRYGIEIWGRNLTDEAYVQGAFEPPPAQGALAAFLGDPRTYGVTVRAKY